MELQFFKMRNAVSSLLILSYLLVTLSALILISVWSNDQLIIKPSYKKKVIWQHVNSSLRPSNTTARFLFTFDQPTNYKGPIVEGWPPGKNRSLLLYIKPRERRYLLQPSMEKLNCQILIVVHSHPDHYKERIGIRNTYAKAMDGLNKTAVIFLLGTGGKSKLDEEQNNFKDLLQADFVDHYNNLTLKTLFTLKFFTDLTNFQHNIPDYLFKADEDSYLNLPSLWRTLYQEIAADKSLLMGAKFSVAKTRFPKTSEKARFTGKWICPKYMYNGQGYPPMLSGSGYVMSRSAANCLYSEALKLPFFHLEDVLVTGFAGEACGIQRRHHNGFRHLPVKLHRIKSTDLMLHYLNFKAKATLFKAGILK